MSKRVRRTGDKSLDSLSTVHVPRTQNYFDGDRDVLAARGIASFASTARAADDAVYSIASRISERMRHGKVFIPVSRPSVAERFSGDAVRLSDLLVSRRVRECVSRKKRRQVLFAKRKAGFSGSARKRHWRRTAWSEWRCV